MSNKRFKDEHGRHARTMDARLDDYMQRLLDFMDELDKEEEPYFPFVTDMAATYATILRQVRMSGVDDGAKEAKKMFEEVWNTLTPVLKELERKRANGHDRRPAVAAGVESRPEAIKLGKMVFSKREQSLIRSQLKKYLGSIIKLVEKLEAKTPDAMLIPYVAEKALSWALLMRMVSYKGGEEGITATREMLEETIEQLRPGLPKFEKRKRGGRKN